MMKKEENRKNAYRDVLGILRDCDYLSPVGETKMLCEILEIYIRSMMTWMGKIALEDMKKSVERLEKILGEK